MLASPDAVDLTPHEREIALLAAAGSSSREIAEALVVSVRTVDNHPAERLPQARRHAPPGPSARPHRGA